VHEHEYNSGYGTALAPDVAGGTAEHREALNEAVKPVTDC